MVWGQALELGGLFLVALLAPNVNFFLPVRPTFLTMLLAQNVPWAEVGIVASLGGVAGVIPLYGIAYGVSNTARVQRWLRHRSVQWLLKKMEHRLFLLLILLVVTPLPDQLIGLAAGAEKYSFRKFLLANLIGRLLVYLPIAYIASRHTDAVSSAWAWVLHLFSI